MLTAWQWRYILHQPITHRWSILWVCLLINLPILAYQDQIDTSATQIFWSVADRLQSGETLNKSDWDAMFAHPAYAQIDKQAQRRRFIEKCMPLAFNPELREEYAAQLEKTGSFSSDLCRHFNQVKLKRSQLDPDKAKPQLRQELALAKELVQAYLPPDSVSTLEQPPIYFAFFESGAFGGSKIILDLLTYTSEEKTLRVRTLAHELHHSYAVRLAKLQPQMRIDPRFDDLHLALKRMLEEGIASLINNIQYLDNFYNLHDSEAQATSSEFIKYFSETPSRLFVIDKALAQITQTEVDLAEIVKEIRQQCPWGVHINGVYMSATIDKSLGRAALLAVLLNPVDFFLTYQKAAKSNNEDRFLFSEEAIKGLKVIRNSAP